MIKNTRNYTLIDLLLIFKKEEIKRFKSFLNSPYFNKDEKIIQLFDFIVSKVLTQKTFDETLQLTIYEKIFTPKSTGQVLSKSQKKTLLAKMSVLYQLALEFLTVAGLKKNKVCQQQLLQQALLEKKQFDAFDRLVQKQQKVAQAQRAKGIEEYALAFHTEMGVMEKLYQTGHILQVDNFEQLGYHLDVYYLLQKLKLQLTMRSIMNVASQKNYDFSTVEALAPLLKLPIYQQNPAIQLRQTVIELIGNPSEKNYQDLISLLDLLQPYITKKDLLDYYTVACNYWARQLITGKKDLYQELLFLYKQMDVKAILLEDGLMDMIRLKNIVTVSCHAKDYSWATEISEKYYTFVKKEHQSSVRSFNLAVIAFFQKNYKQAISHLIRVDKVNLTYDLDGRILLLKAHFLMDTFYDERSMRIFRSAEGFIQKNPHLPSAHKKSYKNFIQLFINLYRIKHRVGKKTLASFQLKMQGMQFIFGKKWLLDQVAELNNRKIKTRRL